MGSGLSTASPKGMPRDAERTKAARQHIEPIVDQLRALRETIQGRVLLAPTPGQEDDDDSESYHIQRERPFYYNDSHYPSAIIVVKTVEDVCLVVRFVSTLDLAHHKLCIAAGCHSAFCMVERSIVLDLQDLCECIVDQDAKTIRIEGGAKIGQAHAALRGTGLGFPTGTNSDTGISGLTLAGGAGYLGGQAGYGCDNVIAARVVLPSGELITATDDNEYADLMRALRGGGGNFGIVVEWTYKLYDVSNAIGGLVVHLCPTQTSLKTLMTYLAECVKDIPDQCAFLASFPVGVPIVACVLTMIGSDVPTESNPKYMKEVPFFQKIIKAKGAWLCVQNTLKRRDYIDDVAILLEPFQQRGYALALGAMVYSFDEAIRDALIHFTRVDHPKNKGGSALIVHTFSGEMRRNDGSRSSLRHRKAEAWIIINAQWTSHSSDAEIQATKDWAHRVKAKMIELGGEDGPHNFCDTDGRRIKFFSQEQRQFLEMAKQKYDPNNIFTLNKNIVTDSE